MILLQQMIQLLSDTPGNVVYHLASLFALQVVFALSLNQWRREPANVAAWRGLLAAGALIVARLALLVVSLLWAGHPLQATAFLPLLEQTFNTVTVILLAWALLPAVPGLPRLNEVLLLLSLLVIAVMVIFFAGEWQRLAADGVAYNSTRQATIWGLIQLSVLSGGLLALLMNGRTRRSLAPFVVGSLLLAHLAHFWNYPEIIPSDTDIAYWVRLGQLVALPLWAALAYRQAIAPLLAAQYANLPGVQQMTRSLALTADLIRPLTPEQRLQAATRMASTILDAAFVGIGTTVPAAEQELDVTSNWPQAGMDAPRSWHIQVADWAPFQTVMQSGKGIELRPVGPGSRQLYALYDALSIGPLGALLIEPLVTADETLGILLVALHDGRNQWSDRDRALAPALAGTIAQAIRNSRDHARWRHEASKQRLNQAAPPLPLPGDTEEAVSGRLITLTEERDKLITNLETANSRLLQAETRAATASKRAHDLAAALAEMERQGQGEQVTILETEIASLREALIEAEEAMAMASAGEGGLSTEWVMMTITRYSGQLEEAQARIEALEKTVAKQASGPNDELLIALLQELRTPLTAIGGFADLLLSEPIGPLNERQRDFVQRIQGSKERLGALLGQLLQLTALPEKAAVPSEEAVSVRDVIETAVSGIYTQLREKNLYLDLDIARELPPLDVNREALLNILGNLLGNACQSSAKNGRIAVSAQTNRIATGSSVRGDIIDYLHLTVSDSGGGISPEDRARVFDPRYRADNPLIAGLGDTAAALSMAHSLATSNGGRLWVDSEPGIGSTFSVLFPVANGDEGRKPAANGRLGSAN